MIRNRHFIFHGAILSLAVAAAFAQTTGSAPPPGATPPPTGIKATGHLPFDRPESWALKYFTAGTMLSGLEPPIVPPEGHRVGSISIGLEAGWIPQLSPEQTQVGFIGTGQEDLNKAPILLRPVIRVGLPWKFTALAAAPPPIEIFGVTPHLLALGLERPIVEREQWRLGARVSGQFGAVKGAFTCPSSVLSSPPGSAGNPSSCIGESSDRAYLRYYGAEIQYAHKIPRLAKLTPHAALGINWMEGEFRVQAPLRTRTSQSDLWTQGIIYSGTAGASYAVTKKVAFSIDAFYTPLSVQRNYPSPRTNDGLFNVRAMVSYDLR